MIVGGAVLGGSVAVLFTFGLILIGIGIPVTLMNVQEWRTFLWGITSVAAGVVIVFIIVVVVTAGSIVTAFGRDLDGRYAQSPLKSWFDGLKSGKGPCCSDADGAILKDNLWESTQSGHYRVKMPFDGANMLADPNLVERYKERVQWKWVDVPDEAVISEPNKFGQTMIWAIGGTPGAIRCFMPGAGI